MASDPETRRDVSDPRQGGPDKIDTIDKIDKFDCDTQLERGFTAAATAFGIAAGAMLWTLVVNGVRPERTSFDPGAARAALPILIFLAGISLGLRWMTNNFYLVDPSRHVVYYHFQLLFLCRVRLFLERRDIFATSVEGRRRRTKRRSWWEYRAVVIRTSGRIVPMGNWEPDDASIANRLARDLATRLACPCHDGHDESRLVVTNDGTGRLSVSVEPHAAREAPLILQIAVAVFVLTILGLVLFKGR